MFIHIMETKKFPIIYKRTENGSVQQWQICVEGNSFYTVEGILNGKLTTSKPTYTFGKNTGKANATTDEEQALKEAEARYKKKLETGYFEDINNIDKGKQFFLPMLAEKYLDRKDKISFPVLVSTKIDGCRMVATNKGLFTRNGKPYVSCPHIHKLLLPLFERHQNWIIDGEIYSHDIPFENIMSLVRKTKPTPEDLTKSEDVVQYWIFDGVTDDASLGFEKRFELIRQEILSIIGDDKRFKFVDAIEVQTPEEVDTYHDEFVQQGFEGLMVRICNSPYENKRSRNLLKFKKFVDEEFEIVDILEGLGNRSGMAGRLVVKTKDNKQFQSGIRGGEEFYKQLLKNKNSLIGKLATIRYQNLTEDGIPRFPVSVDINRGDI